MERTAYRTEYTVKKLPMNERPKCKACGRALRPYFHYIRTEVEKMEQGIGSARIIHYQRFDGEYGYEGNGHFCSQRHGYRWATHKLNSGSCK